MLRIKYCERLPSARKMQLENANEISGGNVAETPQRLGISLLNVEPRETRLLSLFVPSPWATESRAS